MLGMVWWYRFESVGGYIGLLKVFVIICEESAEW